MPKITSVHNIYFFSFQISVILYCSITLSWLKWSLVRKTISMHMGTHPQSVSHCFIVHLSVSFWSNHSCLLSLSAVTVILYSALSVLSFSCDLSNIALHSSPTPLCHINRDVDCPQPLIPSTTFHLRRHPWKHHPLDHHQCQAPGKVSTREAPHSKLHEAASLIYELSAAVKAQKYKKLFFSFQISFIPYYSTSLSWLKFWCVGPV